MSWRGGLRHAALEHVAAELRRIIIDVRDGDGDVGVGVAARDGVARPHRQVVDAGGLVVQRRYGLDHTYRKVEATIQGAYTVNLPIYSNVFLAK